MTILGLEIPPKKKTDEQIKKEMERQRDKIIARAEILRPFVAKEGTGWREYVGLIQSYIESCKKRKAITALDRLVPGNPADDRTLHELKLLDHEIYILSWVLMMPFEQIKRAEKIIEQGNKEAGDGQ